MPDGGRKELEMAFNLGGPSARNNDRSIVLTDDMVSSLQDILIRRNTVENLERRRKKKYIRMLEHEEILILERRGVAKVISTKRR